MSATDPSRRLRQLLLDASGRLTRCRVLVEDARSRRTARGMRHALGPVDAHLRAAEHDLLDAVARFNGGAA